MPAGRGPTRPTPGSRRDTTAARAESQATPAQSQAEVLTFHRRRGSWGTAATKASSAWRSCVGSDRTVRTGTDGSQEPATRARRRSARSGIARSIGEGRRKRDQFAKEATKVAAFCGGFEKRRQFGGEGAPWR
ncbi:hypothetical protein BHE74_00052660 [Ensete ventricosum]|nr:hypothetical protein GW17_00041830 [Ensete ventricosum]RWW41824.1 hypothetical protein BHE74_00052660 [Ensete ventricosum]